MKTMLSHGVKGYNARRGSYPSLEDDITGSQTVTSRSLAKLVDHDRSTGFRQGIIIPWVDRSAASLTWRIVSMQV